MPNRLRGLSRLRSIGQRRRSVAPITKPALTFLSYDSEADPPRLLLRSNLPGDLHVTNTVAEDGSAASVAAGTGVGHWTFEVEAGDIPFDVPLETAVNGFLNVALDTGIVGPKRYSNVLSFAFAPPATGSLDIVGIQADNAGGGTNPITRPFSLLHGSGSVPPAKSLVFAALGIGAPSDLNVSITGYTDLGDVASASGTYRANLGTYHRAMGDTPETGLELSQSGGSNNRRAGMYACFTGQHPTNPIGAYDDEVGTGTTNGTPPSIPIAAGNWAVAVCVGAAATVTAYTNPGDYYDHFESVINPGTNDVVVAIAAKYFEVAGTFTPPAMVGGSANAGESWAAASAEIVRAP